jgi:hypothetical protein
MKTETALKGCGVAFGVGPHSPWRKKLPPASLPSLTALASILIEHTPPTF